MAAWRRRSWSNSGMVRTRRSAPAISPGSNARPEAIGGPSKAAVTENVQEMTLDNVTVNGKSA
jgi:hypothetical protein